MKRIIIALTLCIALASFANGRKRVVYYYDNAGNRELAKSETMSYSNQADTSATIVVSSKTTKQ